jgi:HPt (histidine-containing phosphotransfer) domain-containing protein
MLEELEADPARLLDLVALLQRDNAAQLAELRRGVATNDATVVERVAHRLKGSLGVLGALAAPELLDAASRLEAMGREGEVAGALGALTVLEREMLRLEPTLAAFAMRAGRGER